jgi:hypothetical protein
MQHRFTLTGLGLHPVAWVRKRRLTELCCIAFHLGAVSGIFLVDALPKGWSIRGVGAMFP